MLPNGSFIFTSKSVKYFISRLCLSLYFYISGVREESYFVMKTYFV